MENKLIAKAVELCGGKAALARLIGVKPPTVHQWLNCERPVPATRCAAIELATLGRVTKEQLRSDVFGEPQPKPGTEAA